MARDTANPYDILDLDPSASADDVKAAYLDLVKVWHPDRHANEPPRLQLRAEEKLKAINAAYEALRERGAAPTLAEEPMDELVPMDFGGVWGFIDPCGRMVIAPEFGLARPFAGNLAAVVCHRHWGFIDRTGRYRVNPLYDDCGDFSEGLAPVEQRGRWGYIDATGRYEIAPRFQRALPFRAGWADVLVGSRWGRVNRAGEVYFSAAAARIE